jgi:LPXTG-motif cell wall-anchored protein
VPTGDAGDSNGTWLVALAAAAMLATMSGVMLRRRTVTVK